MIGAYIQKFMEHWEGSDLDPTKVEVKRGTFHSAVGRLLDEMEAHWEEAGSQFDIKNLELDKELYTALQAQGSYDGVEAFYDGKPIGYMSFFISPNPHLKGQLVAQSDAFYVHPEYRGIGVFSKMRKESEKILKEIKGVEVIQLLMSNRVNISRILTRAGYKETNVLYSKRLK